MSHGAPRVKSMITNRPFMLEDPVSPVAKRLGATMHRNSQVTFTDPDALQHSMAVTQIPSQLQEQLHHDWWESAAPLPDQTLPEPMPDAEVAIVDAAPAVEGLPEEQVDMNMTRWGTYKRPQGRLGKLAEGLFRRSTKRTVETQTNETREDETQTVDDPEAEAAAQLAALSIVPEQPQVGAELSFGDALKTQAPLAQAQSSPGAAPSSPGQAGLMLSDLIEQHGPLAMNALSSPVHTAPVAVAAEQHSPAQLAGYQQLPQHLMDSQAAGAAQYTGQLHQAGLAPSTMSADGAEMTFQVTLVMSWCSLHDGVPTHCCVFGLNDCIALYTFNNLLSLWQVAS